MRNGRIVVVSRSVDLTLLVALMAMTGCGPGLRGVGAVQVWAVPASATVFPDAAPELENEVFSDADGSIRLAAAVNETVSFQLVFSSSPSPASVWGVTVTELRQGTQVIARDRFRLYREARVRVDDYPAWYLRLTPFLRRPRAFPDLLIPLTAPRGALPIDIEPGRCGAVWVDVTVPPGTESGTYRGTIAVTTQAGTVRELELVLNVWSFALPQTRHLAFLVMTDAATLLRHHLEVDGRPYAPTRLSLDDPLSDRATAVLDEAMRLLHDHRCRPVLRDVHPVRRVGPGGQPELDWTDYDRLVAGVLDGSVFADRAAAGAWPMPIDDRDPSPDTYGGWGSGPYERFLIDYLRQCIAHFTERGWLDRHFVWIPLPGPTRGDRYRQFERLGRLIEQVDPRLNLVCRLTPQSMAPYGWLDDPFVDVSRFADVWCPPADQADADELARQRAAGKRSWLCPGRPPYSGSLSLIAPAVHARSVAWQAYCFGCEAVLLPAANDWADDGAAAAGSERALIWPGAAYGLGGPIPSIRLKRLLHGAQDYEYLWLLERNRRPGIARLIAAELFPGGGTSCYREHFLDGRPEGWVRDPQAWSLARRLMARELTAAIQTARGDKDEGARDDVERFEQQIEWARFTEAVRQSRARVEGVRVRFDRDDEATPVVVEATVSVFNATHRSFSGTLSLAELPEGWLAGPAAAEIQGLKPGRHVRRTVRARADTIQAGMEGVLPIQVTLQGHEPESEPVTASGRLCVLTSQRLTHPIVIDGKLGDWPLVTNVASDFLLVGALDVPKRHRPDGSRASQLTTVFVCDDDDYLYIAFNCEDDNLAGRHITRSNYVHYDDLWPVGEDLVEVVLDPTGKAAGPGDLLHLVVKANGAVITERGVPCLDRVAEHTEWSPGVVAAIDDRSQSDRWMVEMRIPLAALGERDRVWGANFARFDARRGEYSSWAAARSYLYSPVTLGNMRLEPR